MSVYLLDIIWGNQFKYDNLFGMLNEFFFSCPSTRVIYSNITCINTASSSLITVTLSKLLTFNSIRKHNFRKVLKTNHNHVYRGEIGLVYFAKQDPDRARQSS